MAQIALDPTPERKRTAELAEIETFIAQRGPTRCPDRFAGPVAAALPPREEAQRIAAIAVKPAPTRAETVEYLRRSMRWLFR
jgi:hypothetical protein